MREDMTERIQKDSEPNRHAITECPDPGCISAKVVRKPYCLKTLVLENDTDPLAGGNPYARLKCKL